MIAHLPKQIGSGLGIKKSLASKKKKIVKAPQTSISKTGKASLQKSMSSNFGPSHQLTSNRKQSFSQTPKVVDTNSKQHFKFERSPPSKAPIVAVSLLDPSPPVRSKFMPQSGVSKKPNQLTHQKKQGLTHKVAVPASKEFTELSNASNYQLTSRNSINPGDFYSLKQTTESMMQQPFSMDQTNKTIFSQPTAQNQNQQSVNMRSHNNLYAVPQQMHNNVESLNKTHSCSSLYKSNKSRASSSRLSQRNQQTSQQKYGNLQPHTQSLAECLNQIKSQRFLDMNSNYGVKGTSQLPRQKPTS